MIDLPEQVAELAKALTAMPVAVAVALGGSRALGVGDARSDWDFGLYYRGTIDLAALTAWGTVHPPGSWGRLLNGGALLRCGTENVDVTLRDLDVVEHWTRRAGQGEFEVDHMLGFVAGLPTYLLAAELASCRVLWVCRCAAVLAVMSVVQPRLRPCPRPAGQLRRGGRSGGESRPGGGERGPVRERPMGVQREAVDRGRGPYRRPTAVRGDSKRACGPRPVGGPRRRPARGADR
ncbi:MAG TPA: hypothetical protein VG125_23345 [Pirellulales bacterium]|nr:hypothetical protein [Pirellulales bacterium]